MPDSGARRWAGVVRRLILVLALAAVALPVHGAECNELARKLKNSVLDQMWGGALEDANTLAAQCKGAACHLFGDYVHIRRSSQMVRLRRLSCQRHRLQSDGHVAPMPS